MLARAESGDLRFVVASWCSQLRRSSHASWPDDLFELYRDRALIPLATRTATVAHADDDRSALYGWICAETRGDICIVHGLYVRASRRGYGIEQQLVEYAMGPCEQIVSTHPMRDIPRRRYWPHVLRLAEI